MRGAGDRQTAGRGAMTATTGSFPVIDGPTAAATPVAYINGTWGSVGSYGLTIATQGLQYGTGVFEGIRAYWNDADENFSILRLDDHIRRFLASCEFLRLDIGCQPEDLAEIIAELVVANGYRGDLYVRPLSVKSRLLPGTHFGVKLDGIATVLAIYCVPMPSSVGVRVDRGARCSISSWRRAPDEVLPAAAKITGSYVNIALAVDEAQSAGYDEAIMLNTRGFVAEASTSNVFLVSGNRLVTPSAQSDILPGITRSCVFEIAHQLGLDVVERDVQEDELLNCDEAFLSGTGCELLPVIEVDGRTIGSGNVGEHTQRISRLYHEAVRGHRSDYKRWLTTVQLSPENR